MKAFVSVPSLSTLKHNKHSITFNYTNIKYSLTTKTAMSVENDRIGPPPLLSGLRNMKA